MVSLTVVISSVIVTAALVAAIVAFTPTYVAGVDSVSTTLADLRQNIIVKARIGVEQFMLKPITAIEQHATSHQLGVFDMGRVSDEGKIRMVCDLVNNIDGVLSAEIVSPFVPDTDVYKTLCDGRTLSPPVILQNSSMFFYMFRQDQETLLQNWSNFYAPPGRPTLYVPIPKMYAQMNRTAQYALRAGNGAPMWLPATYGFDSVEYRVGFSFPDRYGNPAALIARLLPKSLKELLASLELRPRARALIVDVKSKFVLAINWNETTEELFENYRNTQLPGPQRMILRTITGFNDSLVNQVVKHFGGADGFFDQPSPSAHDMGSGKDRVFVNIENVTDRYGLDMRVLIAMPELDFMEDTYKSRDMTIGIVVACLVFMVALAILFSIAITKPIDRIGYRMYKTAALQDDDDDDSPSLLSEVKAMQEAYTTMKTELNRLKSYLPQSVLCGNEDDDEEEEEGSVHASGLSSPHSHGSKKSDRSKVPSDSRTILSTGTHAHAPVVVALNTTSGVVQKRVVVVVFNLANFLGESTNALQITKMQSEFLTIVNRLSRESKGVVDSFQGDHIVVTFNAVNNVACPAKRAAAVALHVCEEVHTKHPHLPKVSVGIAYGSAVVGNTGSHDMQRFNVIGPVYQRALAIERHAATTLRTPENHNLPFVIFSNSSIISEVSVEFYFEIVDVVLLPGNRKQRQEPEKIVHITQMRGAAGGQDGEWMYELEEGEKGDPYAKVNAIFDAICAADYAKAKELLDERGEVADTAPDRLGVARATAIVSDGDYDGPSPITF